MSDNDRPTPHPVVISGPSGVGKGSVVAALLERLPARTCVSATTRAPRDGEVDGVDYHFLTNEAFDQAIEAGDFVEWAEFAGNRYGTLTRELTRSDGAEIVLLEIEVQGARSLRESHPDATQIMLLPPDMDELSRRLRDRGTESAEAIDARLSTAQREIAQAAAFDHVVFNRDLAETVDKVHDIITAVLAPNGSPAAN